MPRKPKPRYDRNLEKFHKMVRAALEDYHDPAKLERKSPLATVYFLGNLLERVPPGIEFPRGEALRIALWQAMDAIWPDHPHQKNALVDTITKEEKRANASHYDFFLLESHYFYRYIAPSSMVQKLDWASVARAAYFRHLDNARARLANILLEQCQSPSRQRPPQIHSTLVGHETLVGECLDALVENQMLAITGAGGIGKTTLGSAIAAAWSLQCVFWFSFGLTLENELEHLLSHLGEFFRSMGYPQLWQHLIVEQGKVSDLNRIFGIVSYILENLGAQQSLLFIFDDVSKLYHPDAGAPSATCEHVTRFLDKLRGQVPVLLLGQRVLIPPDRIISLQSLSLAHTERLLKHHHVSVERASEFHSFTQGNPLLLQLLLALHKGGISLAEIREQSINTTAFLPLVNRLWQNLAREERRILHALSVYRHPAPKAMWQTSDQERRALENLLDYGLVQKDAQDGLTLTLLLRDSVYANLSAERREQLHFKAAGVRAGFGEYTSAAYHYLKADTPRDAVLIWYPHMDYEIKNRHIGEAREIFNQISSKGLSAETAQVLCFLQAKLNLLLGNAKEALDDLSGVENYDSLLGPLSDEITGDALDMLGESEASLIAYQDGLDKIIDLLELAFHLHRKKSFVGIRQKDLGFAWDEAQHTRHEAEMLWGTLQEERGNLREAQDHYRAAHHIAEELNDSLSLARASDRLAHLAIRNSDLDAGEKYLQAALAHYQQMGLLFQEHIVYSKFSALYLQVEDFAQAIEKGEKAISFFAKIVSPYWISVCSSNIAEAYFELGDLDAAQHYATLCLAQEQRQSIPYALFVLGRIRAGREQFTQAKAAYLESIRVAEENEDMFLVPYSCRALGEMYHEQNRRSKACAMLQKAHRLFKALAMDKETDVTSKRLRDANCPDE